MVIVFHCHNDYIIQLQALVLALQDQLFFLKLNSYGHKIYWSKNIKVFETIHRHRQNLNWLINRSFRLGVLGHYIDMSIYGKPTGFLINYLGN